MRRRDQPSHLHPARRAGALVLAGAPADVLAAPRKLRLARDVAFKQGVASGEPGARAITLWTRLEGLERAALVELEVARDDRVVHRERLVVAGNRDWTARSRVTGLAPGEEYTYRFVTRDGASPAGRFRTAYPAGSSERLRIAFFSCQEFVAGYYHAHADLTKQDVDLVVCLGDYVYEKAYGGSIRSDTTAPDGETQTLAEYRAKYSLYHTDPHLLEVRRKFPLVAIWDDHEVEDNYAGDIPGGAAENRRVPFDQRRGNGYRAFFEHMPRRLRRDFRTYGRIPLGNAELFLLDTRQFRDDQPCSPTDGAVSTPCPAPITDDPVPHAARRCPDALAEGRAQRLAGALEARRQPGDDHVARRRPAQPAQHRLVGRLRRRPPRTGRGAAGRTSRSSPATFTRSSPGM